MRREEAREIYEIVTSCDIPAGSTILNIGSSTQHFREVVQPHIHGELFEPLEKDGYRIIHSDIKSESGIDIVGDVLDRDFQDALKQLQPDIVICSNLLEHLVDRRAFISALDRIVPASRYLLLSVPYSYPYHGDPIDTLFRPSPTQLASEFHSWKAIQLRLVESGSFWDDLKETGRPAYNLARHLISAFLAIRDFNMLYRRTDRFRWLFRNYRVSIALLER